MPSTNSYKYYNCFKACLKRWNKKGHSGWDEKAGKIGVVPHYSNGEEAAIASFMRSIMEASPSDQMGGDDWCDKFIIHSASEFLCTGTWCSNNHCPSMGTNIPYNCAAGTRPADCKIYRDWRKIWRSYPESEVCKACRYFKPDVFKGGPDRWRKQIAEKNKYKCYCRARELPEACPKRKKEKAVCKPLINTNGH